MKFDLVKRRDHSDREKSDVFNATFSAFFAFFSMSLSVLASKTESFVDD